MPTEPESGESHDEPGPAGSGSRAFGYALATIAAVALLLRISHAAFVLSSPLGETLVGDSRYYHEEALRILGRLPDENPAAVRFMNVGYPFFLAATYLSFGARVVPVLVIQALLGALTAVLVSLISFNLLASRRAAWFAGLLYAFYSGAVFYDGLLLTPSLANAFVAISLYTLTRRSDGPRLRHAAFAGFALGFAVLLRPNLGLLAVAFGAVLAWFADAELRRAAGTGGWLPAATLVLASVAMPLPTIVYHGFAHGVWVPVSANAGMNFWVGNHLGATGMYTPAGFSGIQSPAGEEASFVDEARLRLADPGLSLAAADRFWLREGLRQVREDPLSWLGLTLRKLAYFVNYREIRTNVGLDFMRRFSPVLSFSTLGFPWIAILGAAGIAHLAWTGRARAVAFLSCVAGASLLTCLLFFVSGEYRHPASLALAVAGGWAVHAGLARVRGASDPTTRRIAASAVVGLLTAPAVAWPYRTAEAAADPQVDAFNYSVAILATPRPSIDGGGTDFGRALCVLDRLRADGEAGAVLADAYFWLHTRAAAELQDAGEAARALDWARRMVASLFVMDDGPFRRYLQASLADRLALLTSLDLVRDREGLLGEARGIAEAAGIAADPALEDPPAR